MHALRGVFLEQETALKHYELVIPVSAELISKIRSNVKKVVSDSYARICINPHIRLARFEAKEPMEETLVRYLHRILSVKSAIQLHLNNYGAIPPNKIYLRIQEGGEINNLVQELGAINHYIQSSSCPAPQYYLRPHFTILENLAEHNYLNVMLQFSQSTLHQALQVNEVVLLKKDNCVAGTQIIQKFKLKPQD